MPMPEVSMPKRPETIRIGQNGLYSLKKSSSTTMTRMDKFEQAKLFTAIIATMIAAASLVCLYPILVFKTLVVLFLISAVCTMFKGLWDLCGIILEERKEYNKK